MIEIDGAHGEGGGQILRTSMALSAVLREPVRVVNIRAGRPRPGLSAQHVTSIEAVAQLCDAKADGLHVGAEQVEFRPGVLTGGDFSFDVGTAGSVSLVLQTCLLPAAMSKGPVRMTIRGGTDTRWAPPIDFMRLVHAPVIKRMGISCDIELPSRGFYPEGGGEVVATVYTCPRVEPAVLRDRGHLVRIHGIACTQNLPEHVMSRMRHAALKTMVGHGPVKIESDARSGRSTGAGLVLAAEFEQTVLGESALGEKGVRAETLGERCAEDLLETIGSGATVDEHMLDQVLLYMAVADGRSEVLAEEMTGHAETNMWVIEQFMGRRFKVEKRDGLTSVTTA